MSGRFRIYQKHRIHGTTAVVVIADLSYGAILGLKADKAEERVTTQIHACTFYGPDADNLTTEQALSAITTPLPMGWVPTRPLFESPKDVADSLNVRQVQDLVTAIADLSRPSEAELSTFRGPGGAAAGAEPASNGAALEHPAIGAAARGA